MAEIGWDYNTARNLWFQTDVDRSGTLDFQVYNLFVCFFCSSFSDTNSCLQEFLRFCSRPDVQPYILKLEARLQ